MNKVAIGPTRRPIKISGKIAGSFNLQATHWAIIPSIIIPASSSIPVKLYGGCTYRNLLLAITNKSNKRQTSEKCAPLFCFHVHGLFKTSVSSFYAILTPNYVNGFIKQAI